MDIGDNTPPAGYNSWREYHMAGHPSQELTGPEREMAEVIGRAQHRRGAVSALVIAGGPLTGLIVGGLTGSVGYGLATLGGVWLLGLAAAVTRSLGA